MAAVEISVNSGPTDFPNYPTEARDDNGDWVVTERYWIKESAISHSLPAHNATTNQHGVTVTDRIGNTLKCRSVSISGTDAPGVMAVELTYAQSSTNISIKGPIDNPRSVRLSREDIPIDDERLLDANGGPFSALEIAAAKKARYTSMALYQVEYTYTDLDGSFAWTEAAIISTLQSTGSPTGVGSPSANKWELTGKEIDETDDATVIREHWRYAAAGVLPIKA